MRFPQKRREMPWIMHILHPICENYTLDGPEKGDYTEFQISSISISDKYFDKQVRDFE